MPSMKPYLLCYSPQLPGIQSIYSRDPVFKVSVYYTDQAGYRPDPTALQLYSSIEGRPVVFEAPDLVAAGGRDILDAIQWYASYRGMPALKLSLYPPKDALMDAKYGR